SFQQRRGHCCDGPHCHSYLEASCAIFRISTGVVDPETVAITNSRSKERPSIGRVTRPRAAAERPGRMQIAWPTATPRCTQSSLSVRKRGRITTSRRAKCSRPTHDVSSRKPTRERVRPRRLALITYQRQVSQQLTDGVISIGASPLSFVCSQPRPSR